MAKLQMLEDFKENIENNHTYMVKDGQSTVMTHDDVVIKLAKELGEANDALSEYKKEYKNFVKSLSNLSIFNFPNIRRQCKEIVRFNHL